MPFLLIVTVHAARFRLDRSKSDFDRSGGAIRKDALCGSSAPLSLSKHLSGVFPINACRVASGNRLGRATGEGAEPACWTIPSRLNKDRRETAAKVAGRDYRSLGLENRWARTHKMAGPHTDTSRWALSPRRKLPRLTSGERRVSSRVPSLSMWSSEQKENIQ